MARQCFIIIEGQSHPDRGYIPSLVTEDEPGHAPLTGRGELSEPWYWGTDITKARSVCAQANLDRFGLSEADTQAIMESSIVAQMRVDGARDAEVARREAADREYRRKLGRPL